MGKPAVASRSPHPEVRDRHSRTASKNDPERLGWFEVRRFRGEHLTMREPVLSLSKDASRPALGERLITRKVRWPPHRASSCRPRLLPSRHGRKERDLARAVQRRVVFDVLLVDRSADDRRLGEGCGIALVLLGQIARRSGPRRSPRRAGDRSPLPRGRRARAPRRNSALSSSVLDQMLQAGAEIVVAR